MLTIPLGELIFHLVQTVAVSCAVIVVLGYIDKWVRNRNKNNQDII